MGNLATRGVSAVFNPMRPAIRYTGQVASEVGGDIMKESAQRMAEGRPAVKDSPDALKVMTDSAKKQAVNKAVGELTHRVLNLRGW